MFYCHTLIRSSVRSFIRSFVHSFILLNVLNCFFCSYSQVLSCGTPLISDWFEALEDMFRDIIHYVRVEEADIDGQIYRALEKISRMTLEEMDSYASVAHSIVVENHTYDNRMGQFLDFYNHIISRREQQAKQIGEKQRFGMQTLLVLLGDNEDDAKPELNSMLSTLSSNYEVLQARLSEVINIQQWWAGHDIVLIVSDFGGEVDAFFRRDENNWPRKWKVS